MDQRTLRLRAVRSGHGGLRWFAVREGRPAHSAEAVHFPVQVPYWIGDPVGGREVVADSSVVAFARRRDLADACARVGAELLPGSLPAISTREYLAQVSPRPPDTVG